VKLKMDKYLFCIDAGFVSTGLSIFLVENGKLIFNNCLTIQTKKSEKKKSVRVADDDSERIKNIIIGINEFIDPYLNHSLMAAVELPTGGAQGARANRTMGMITGSIVTYLEIMGWPTEYVSPNDVKIAVTGSRKASKDEIMEKIKKEFINFEYLFPKTKSKFEHIADSIGCAVHIKRHSEMFKMFSKK
jgi:Holliday junction resolvasome RuvABC endonuclease subunit